MEGLLRPGETAGVEPERRFSRLHNCFGCQRMSGPVDFI
jgi:hypothetical protein